MPYYYFITVLCWVALIGFWLFSAVHAKRTIKRNWKGWWVRMAIAIVVVIAISSSPKTSHTPPNAIIGWIGSLLCVIGVSFAIWARVHLGRNWGMPMSLKERPELVTSGPYRYVRHPIYSGILLAYVGTALGTGQWWWWIFFVLMGSYFIYSATQEEKIMAGEFPESYAVYRQRSKMLIPFIF